MKKELRKVISVLSATAVPFAVCAACGDETAQTPRSLSLAVQVEILSEGERNAFMVHAEGLSADENLIYEVSYNDGAYEAVKSTADRTVVYKCQNAGEYSVRVKTSDGKTVSNPCDFSVAAFGGDTFGRAPSGEGPTNNVDLRGDFGDTPSIEHKAVNTISDEYAFVKGVESDSFYFTAFVDIIGANAGDRNPKAGLFCKSGTTKYYFAFDVKPDLAGNETVFVSYNSSSGWGWPGKVMRINNLSFRNGSTRKANELGMLRARDAFYLFVNGECVGKAAVNGYIAPSAVGTYTMAQNAVFSGYMCYDKDSEEYATALAVGIQMFN